MSMGRSDGHIRKAAGHGACAEYRCRARDEEYQMLEMHRNRIARRSESEGKDVLSTGGKVGDGVYQVASTRRTPPNHQEHRDMSPCSNSTTKSVTRTVCATGSDSHERERSCAGASG